MDIAPRGRSDRAGHGRSLSSGHVWKILAAMEWSLQRPAKQARERNEEGRREWMAKRWPAIKKRRRRRAWILFQDESGVSERPPVRRTWLRREKLRCWFNAFNWKKLSISAALGYRWTQAIQTVVSDPSGSYNDQRLIAFVRDLKKHLRGQKAILIWDGLPAHKSRKMKQYLESQRGWLQVETLPGYSPDPESGRGTYGATSKDRNLPTAVLPD